MPKKTKKEKIRARFHRQQFLSKNNNPQVVKKQIQAEPGTITHSLSSSFKLADVAVITPKTSQTAVNYSYVSHDLIRITIFTVLALIFQGVLYFLLNRG